ncbi:unnamed protein product [Adineta ricciae]|uniref:Uncharacterized protein n=1 Tax=Adineta ricciae TaxID=249248 RepID=A0A813UTW5_ADIRI|nr:unnamed protein product [Adineta ricciae]CAF1580755.1 unnamed protein product [Adineta ricciae]
MSADRSISTNSTSSASAPVSKKRLNEPMIDPSNLLYNDRQHYQIIFTNDSRFFDTSLHLFKSYCDLGYIESDQKKSKKNLPPLSSSTFKSQTSGFNSRWRPKPVGFSSNHDANGNTNGFLKQPFARYHDYAMSHRSDPGTSKVITSKFTRENSPLVVSSQRQSMPVWNQPSENHVDDDSDDPDIIVTRL